MSPYAASKLATEGYVLGFGSSYGMATLPFRFFNVYGPRQSAGHVYAAVIPVFIDAALRGEPLPLNGDGLQSRDFTYVDTVTWVLADAVHRKGHQRSTGQSGDRRQRDSAGSDRGTRTAARPGAADRTTAVGSATCAPASPSPTCSASCFQTCR